MKRKKKQRLILDVDSTEDPAHGRQEHVAFNGHFGKSCFHPLFAFTSDGDCLRAKLRPGNVHSADGVVTFLDPIVNRYRARFALFWLRGDAAFAQPEVYEYCEGERVTYFIRLPANAVLNRLIDPYLTRPVGRPLCPQGVTKRSKWQDRRIIPVKIASENSLFFYPIQNGSGRHTGQCHFSDML
jgi:hypothetical protein